MSKSRVHAGRGVVLVAALSMVGLAGLGPAGAAQQYPAVDQPGVTAKEIKVGGVVTASNDPTGSHLDTAYDGVEAYFKYINSTGGVYDREARPRLQARRPACQQPRRGPEPADER